VCGPSSAIGLDASERVLWPMLKERLRRPGHVMGLMRGVLAEDAEVAAVVATSPEGRVQPLAILVTPMIAEELELPSGPCDGDICHGKVGDYDVDVLMGTVGEDVRPVALMMTSWIFEHLAIYTRRLWYPRRPVS
jgi:hypothetical protein